MRLNKARLFILCVSLMSGVCMLTADCSERDKTQLHRTLL